MNRSCPGCGLEFQSQSRFCSACGIAHASSPAEQTLSNTHQQRNQVARDHIYSVPDPVESMSRASGERRRATVLFSDLSGYTAMNERFDPERVQLVMDTIKHKAEEIIERNGGKVTQFVGDEIMSLFGYPIAHEDDPLRCALSALELHAMVRETSSNWVEPMMDIPVRLHSGFSTGLAVVRRDTPDHRGGKFPITGDTVNTAARLRSKAENDEILCSDSSYISISEYIHCEPSVAVELKGKAGVFKPWRILEPTGIQSRFEASTRRGLTQFEGREDELALLKAYFDTAARSAGHCVAVAGDAGIGKTRFMHEFTQTLPAENCIIASGNCQTYGSTSAYFPIVDALKMAMELRPTMTATQLHESTVSQILGIAPELRDYLPHLLYLLAIPSEAYVLDKSTSGETLGFEFEVALQSLFVALAKKRTLVLIYEDWHWADDASRSFLLRFVESIHDQRILIIIVTREDGHGNWIPTINTTLVRLEPLSHEHTQSMLEAVLGETPLSVGLSRIIYERTEGNALFNEEIGRALLDAGALTIEDGVASMSESVGTLELPLTVQAVVQSRLDLLDEASLEVLSVATVIGRTFDLDVLSAVSSQSDSLNIALECLLNRGFIRQMNFRAPIKFRFNHAITQEVSYDTLLITQRRKLHASVAQALETVYADRKTEYFEELATHYHRAGIVHKAIEYFGLAARRSGQLQMISHAIEQYRTAIELIDTVDCNDDIKRVRIDYSLAFGRLASAYPSRGIYQTLMQSYAFAQELNDTRRLAQVTLALGGVSWIESRFESASDHLLECMKYAAACGDEVTEAFAKGNIGQTLFYRAKYSEGIAYLEPAIETVKRLGHGPSQSILSNFLSLQYFMTGQFERSAELQNAVLSDAVSNRHFLMEQVNRLWTSLRLSLQGDWPAAIEMCDKALELDRITHAKYIEGYLRCGKAYAASMLDGPRSDLIVEFESGMGILAHINHKLAVSLYEANLAEMFALAGECEGAIEHAGRALECAEREELLGEAVALRAIAVATARAPSPDWATAQTHINKSIEIAQQRGQLPDVAIAQFRHGELLQLNGDNSAATSQFNQAQRKFRQLNMTWWASCAANAEAHVARGAEPYNSLRN